MTLIELGSVIYRCHECAFRSIYAHRADLHELDEKHTTYKEEME